MTAPSASRSRRKAPRLPIVVAVVVVLGGLWAIERADDDAADPARIEVDVQSSDAVAARAAMPMGFPADALSSTWFCAGGTASADGLADHTVVVANPTDQPVVAVVTAYPGTFDGDANAQAINDQPQVARSVSVAAYGRTEVRLADLTPAPVAAALVEAAGGGVVVEHRVAGAGGLSSAPCAASASGRWYFAAGSTSRDAREIIVLFNPFPDTAVVDLTFVTTEGFRSPQPYDGFPIPGESVVALDLGQVVARHAQVSTAVVARSGQIVADRIQMFDGTGSAEGLSLSLGAPMAAQLWHFPDGLVAEGVNETYTLFNPGDTQAEVDLEIHLDDPAASGAIEPIAVSVPPGAYTQVQMNAEQRVPVDVGHSVTVRVRNDVPVVAERTVSAVSGVAATPGLTLTLGSPLVATDWVLADGATTETVGEVLVVQNPSIDSIARVSVSALSGRLLLPLDGLQEVEVPPAGRLAVDLGQVLQREQLSLVVEATMPVVVERRLQRVDGELGLSQAIGIPMPDGAVRPDPIAG